MHAGHALHAAAHAHGAAHDDDGFNALHAYVTSNSARSILCDGIIAPPPRLENGLTRDARFHQSAMQDSLNQQAMASAASSRPSSAASSWSNGSLSMSPSVIRTASFGSQQQQVLHTPVPRRGSSSSLM